MIKSVNQIRLELSAIQEAHLQLNSFFWGDFLRAYKENRLNYPLMGCFYPTSSILRNQTQLSLRIYVADKLFKDWSNLNDVESDTLQTCRDIFNIMNNSMRWQSIGRVQSCTVTKFINRGGDEVAGHEMTINFLIRDRDGICGLPLEGYDYDQIDGDLCSPATYTITDSESTILYTGSIQSGGNLNQPIQDSTVSITDDIGNVLHSVTVLAEGSATQAISDSTVTITDDSANTLYTLSVNAEGSASQIISDSTVNINNSASTLLHSVSVNAEGTASQTISDSTVTIKDDSNNTLYTLSVVAEGSANQVISDSTAVLKTTGGATISTTSINAQASADITAPDTALEVNGVSEGSVVVGSTVDVQLSDSGGTVTPTSVTQVGNDLQIVLPDAPVSVTRSTATLMKTGQTTSYRTGDDGDLEAGRATSFLVLDSAPLHNDGTATLNATTNRFTDTLGGQTYVDDWVLDWSTWNGSTLLGYYRVAQTAATWNNAIDNSLGTFGTFAGCRLPNITELNNAVNHNVSAGFNYSPFSFTAAAVPSLWTSTTTTASNVSALYFLQGQGTFPRLAKTSTSVYIPVRTFSLSLLNVLS